MSNLRAFYPLLILLVAVQTAGAVGTSVKTWIQDNEIAARLESCQRLPEGCP